MNQNRRVCIWDNLKCILIFSVVVGHFTNQFAEQSDWMRSISIFIYSFHMPLFIFLSGLLQKKWDEDHPFQWSKPIYYMILGYLLKIMIYGIKVFFGQNAEFSFFSDTGIPWYMFAMAAYMTMMYLTRKWNAKVWFPLTIVIACLAGYVEEIGSFLYLSRIIVFFPFYFAGYLLKPETVQNISQHKWMRWLSVAVLALCLYISFFHLNDVYSYIRLFTARNAYALINVEGCNWVHRFVWYGVSALIGMSVISLTPNRELSFAGVIGQRTLQIYFWHRLVLYVLMYSGFADSLKITFAGMWIPVYLFLAVAITLALSLDLFGKPLRRLQKCEQWVCRRLVAYGR
ncbi:MAG: acyltransferase family protein [Lachnospiraceae bacterium]|nr:acyltransferase family protein [Lachnospiraceae bacterium]